MPSLADHLPPEFAAHVHPEWRENERAYWGVRDAVLAEYAGPWVAFADGRVVAAGRRPVLVLHAGLEISKHPFLIRAGAEDEPRRIRRQTYPYDKTYPDEPLPVVSAEFRAVSGVPGVVLDAVIPDTGADLSVLP